MKETKTQVSILVDLHVSSDHVSSSFFHKSDMIHGHNISWTSMILFVETRIIVQPIDRLHPTM